MGPFGSYESRLPNGGWNNADCPPKRERRERKSLKKGEQWFLLDGVVGESV